MYIPYDQVTDRLGPLSRERPESMGIILIENQWKAARRPYHKQKLALILCNLRHFALEQAARGVAVRHEVVRDQSGLYSTALKNLATELGPIEVMDPAERELRIDLDPLFKDKSLTRIRHEGWLTSLAELESIASKNGTYRMDAFYRKVRQRSGVLMEAGKPYGGKYSFDNENRQPWKGSPIPPTLPQCSTSDISEEVADLINKYMSYHPGEIDLKHLPATQEDSDNLWTWAKENSLPIFGPYEDAMSSEFRGMFHSRTSALLNIHRLTPKQLVEDALDLPIPLASKEGFIRQILGWREFLHKVHLVSDGFRKVDFDSPAPRDHFGDGGYKLWAGVSFAEKHGLKPLSNQDGTIDGGAQPSYLQSHNPLPPAYWGKSSGLNCLDTVVKAVWDEAYSHHITRLMVLANLATLLDISPRDLTDWFWVAYFDAYDWVVEPNVLAMGTFGVGDMITTKPYISGAAYINKMSDYCRGCQFNPAKNCPITRLYWAFLARHQNKLADNLRLAMPLNSLKKRSAEERTKDQLVFAKTLETLLAGKMLVKDQFD